MNQRWVDTQNLTYFPNVWGGGWQATEKPVISRCGCWRLADNGKINREKGMSNVAAWAFPFLSMQKLDILENMMKIKSSAIMIGYFTDNGPKLFAEKAAGNVCGCIGFTKDRNSGLNVPNTLLKKDIRNVVNSPVQKIYAIISKACTEEKYSVVEKLDKCIDIKECLFSDEIEKILDSKIRSI